MWNKCSLARTTHNLSHNKVTIKARYVILIIHMIRSIANTSLDLDIEIEIFYTHGVIFELQKIVSTFNRVA